MFAGCEVFLVELSCWLVADARGAQTTVRRAFAECRMERMDLSTAEGMPVIGRPGSQQRSYFFSTHKGLVSHFLLVKESDDAESLWINNGAFNAMRSLIATNFSVPSSRSCVQGVRVLVALSALCLLRCCWCFCSVGALRLGRLSLWQPSGARADARVWCWTPVIVGAHALACAQDVHLAVFKRRAASGRCGWPAARQVGRSRSWRSGSERYPEFSLPF